MSNSRRQLDATSSPIQNHSPDQPYYSLDAFYSELLSKQFKSSVEAIAYCRDLCSNYGFTVKQEQSTHKNIYVYCSREGLPDSYRNPKANPQRNRPSQRCECRWRIVLYENSQSMWEFRKSQNADAFIHNHSLMKPEEIKKEWPREVSEMIFALARQRLPTHEIRQQVREQYPTISWDDRRFYNRLSEERQKMKQRDTAARTTRLVNLSAQLCMLNAGSEDLSHYVESKLVALLEDTCRFSNTSLNEMNLPLPFPSHEDSETCIIKKESSKESSESISKKIAISSKKSFESLPKGYLAVTIPEYTFHIKMYNQNSMGDIRRAIYDNKPNRRRSRFASEEDETMELGSPARKLSRHVLDDELDSLSCPSSPSNSQQNLIFPQKDQNVSMTAVHNPSSNHLLYNNTTNSMPIQNNHQYNTPPPMYQEQIYDSTFIQSDLGFVHHHHQQRQQQQQQQQQQLVVGIPSDTIPRSVSCTFPPMPLEDNENKTQYYSNRQPIMTFNSSNSMIINPPQSQTNFPYNQFVQMGRNRQHQFVQQQTRISSGPK
ncbi:hypothetical protein G6F60_011908 [Rhizopus arrhizus]|nr:hypothetical protein G6F60_011908 [Rhizopus arrhizus]